jgi:predicted nucleic acid-binding protein
MSVLVDTSVWSLLFRRDQEDLSAREGRALDSLEDLVLNRRARVIGPIRQELLSGIKNVQQREQLRIKLRDFEDEVLVTTDYEVAAEMSCKCRSVGLAVGSIDALICSVAVLRGWRIFTHDKDFERFAQPLGLNFHIPA